MFFTLEMCLITPHYITTVENRTVPVDEIKLRKKDTLVTADCSLNPRFALYLDGSSNLEELSFTLYAGSDTLNVKPTGKNTTVLLNGIAFTGEKYNTNIK